MILKLLHKSELTSQSFTINHNPKQIEMGKKILAEPTNVNSVVVGNGGKL